MSIAIAPYTENEIAAVKDFNERLQTGGAPPDYVFSESPISRWLPPVPGAPVYNEFYLALEDGVVRGTYALKHQKFSFHGEIRPVLYLHHPFSEGIVNKKYAQVGVQILRHIMRSHPVLFALGMGGYDRPLPRMLIGLNWNHCLIPFYFLICHPARFVRNLQALRQSKRKRFLADLAAFSGAGWMAAKTLQSVKGFRGMRTTGEAVVVEQFDEWADEVWQACAAGFAMLAVRDSSVLRTLYPASNRNFIRVKVTAKGRLLGWAVVADIQKQNHPQYGDLRVGTILDGLSRAQDATAVIAAATRVLLDRNVDLITSNQSHGAWTRGLAECGFFKGPSNFIFAASKGLSEMIQPFQQTVPRIHLNRGDGDNLLQYL